MMVHVDESLNFHTSRNSYVNFDLISLPGLTLPTETNDIPENLKKITRVKASRPLVDYELDQIWFHPLTIACNYLALALVIAVSLLFDFKRKV